MRIYILSKKYYRRQGLDGGLGDDGGRNYSIGVKMSYVGGWVGQIQYVMSFVEFVLSISIKEDNFLIFKELVFLKKYFPKNQT